MERRRYYSRCINHGEFNFHRCLFNFGYSAGNCPCDFSFAKSPNQIYPTTFFCVAMGTWIFVCNYRCVCDCLRGNAIWCSGACYRCALLVGLSRIFGLCYCCIVLTGVANASFSQSTHYHIHTSNPYYHICHHNKLICSNQRWRSVYYTECRSLWCKLAIVVGCSSIIANRCNWLFCDCT